MISDPKQQQDRWKEYLCDLLNPSEASPSSHVSPDPIENHFPDLPEGPPSLEEVNNALKKLKNNKSPGIDRIANEQLKTGSDTTAKWLQEIF